MLHRIAIVADPDQASADAVTNALGDWGVDVHLTGSSNQALRALERLGAPILVLGTGLPGLVQVVQEARAWSEVRHVSVVVVYKPGEQFEQSELVRAGVTAFLRRPVKAKDLSRIIHDALGDEFGVDPMESTDDLLAVPLPGTSPSPVSLPGTSPAPGSMPVLDANHPDELTPLPQDALDLLRQEVDRAVLRLNSYTEDELSQPILSDKTVVDSVTQPNFDVAQPLEGREPAPWFRDVVLALIDQRLAELFQADGPLQKAVMQAVEVAVARELRKARGSN